MSARHTPIPWKQDPTGDVGFWVIGTSKVLVAETLNETCSQDESAANAEFIVRACNAHADLLEACQDALSDSVDASTYPDGPCLNKHVRDALRAAIKKAAGQP
jgi:hypothetical protein